MNTRPKPILFHSPNTRSSAARTLIEELGADVELRILNMKASEQRGAAYLAINPMGKVPALLHDGVLVTEQVALFIYLADLFPAAGLAPALDDPQRGAYLRWLVFYGSCFEPAVVDRYQKHTAEPVAMCPYGDFDTMFKTLTDQLAAGPYLLGKRFSAADVLWGTALEWTTAFGLIPKTPVIADYIERVISRPAVQRVKAEDERLAAAHAADVEKAAG